MTYGYFNIETLKPMSSKEIERLLLLERIKSLEQINLTSVYNSSKKEYIPLLQKDEHKWCMDKIIYSPNPR